MEEPVYEGLMQPSLSEKSKDQADPTKQKGTKSWLQGCRRWSKEREMLLSAFAILVVIIITLTAVLATERLKGHVSDIKEDATSRDGRIDKMEQRMASHDTALEMIRGNITNLMETAHLRDAQLDALEKQLASFEAKTDMLKRNITELEEEGRERDGRIFSLEKRLDFHDRDRQRVRGNISTIKEEARTREARVAELEQQLAVYQTERKNWAERVIGMDARLSSRLEELEAKYRDLSVRQAALRMQISGADGHGGYSEAARGLVILCLTSYSVLVHF